MDGYQELIGIDLQYDIIRPIAVFCEYRTDIVQADLLLAYIKRGDEAHLVHAAILCKNVGTRVFTVSKNKCNRKTG